MWNTAGDAGSSVHGTVSPISLPLSQAANGVGSCGLGSSSQLGNFLGSLFRPIVQSGVQGVARKICAATGGVASGKIQPNTLLLVGAGLFAIVVVFGMRSR